jgi:hypothetical protein
MTERQARRAVPNWFWIAFGVWFLVYTPAAIYFFGRRDVNWFVIFAIVIIPLWFIVRLWVHRTSKARND